MQNYEYDEDLFSFLRYMNTSPYSQHPQSHVVSNHAVSQMASNAESVDDENCVTWQGQTSTNNHTSRYTCDGSMADMGFSGVTEIKIHVKKEVDNMSPNALVTSTSMNIENFEYDEDLCSILRDMNTSPYSQPPQSHVVSQPMHNVPSTLDVADKLCDPIIGYHNKVFEGSIAEMEFQGLKEIKALVKKELDKGASNVFGSKDPNLSIVGNANLSVCRTNPANITDLNRIRESNTDPEYDPVFNMATVNYKKGLFSTFNTTRTFKDTVSLVKVGLIVASVFTTAFVLRKRFF